MKHSLLVLITLPLCFTCDIVFGDLFGSDPNTKFEIEFVHIGNPGNVADATGRPTPPHPTGKVNYAYRIAKYKISEEMIDKANAEGGLGITHLNRGGSKAATNISWFEAAQFVNWLNTDSGNTPAYKFSTDGDFQLWQPMDAGYDPNNLYRNSQARYFLPSVDEWYKAAYYDPSGMYFDYPTGSDTPPTAVATGTTAGTAVYDQNSFEQGPADIMLAGGLSPYGTMGQGGNVHEWEETSLDLLNDSVFSARGIRGGSWLSSTNVVLSSSFRASNQFPNFGANSFGIRVASIPEPSTVLIGVLATAGLLLWRIQ